MSEDMSVSIPVDEDGFLLLQCPSCRGFFKVRSEDYEADDVEELWCPLCGLKNDSFWPDEVIELAKAKALNQFLGDFAKELSGIGRSSSRQSLIKLSVSSRFDHEREGEMLPAVDAYETATCKFCGRTEKLKPLPKYVGAFCAFCGERL